MSADEQTQDAQDKSVPAAGRGRHMIGTLDGKGVTEDELSESTPHPRAGGEAEPAGTAGKRTTGEEKAAQNRAEDPPA